ncbi:TPA: LytTR family transcriptional regulator DNA-binding domain-containing protein [Streptococcus suis]|nr:LytTR family transcriptional regulator DNA-binding domain-containing protein [Streptococcus suis]HEM4698176.1 LytTR family transcriptional regulator DNA-binding domain-containing protein [Streptococcus suis]HEM4702124.1 LytTR family transcriptional regulator DNA-binding domain-containing protein [Streptococcus suis]HEM4702317.1 LytTR family transcriptional regulator DNA-binding domain-containing protein [Streptococcus suis]
MNHIIVSENNRLVKVMFQDIFYIRTDETNPRILKIFTGNHIYQKYGRLKDIETEACLTFTRCHKKFLVNLGKVVSIDKKERMLIFSNNIEGIECSRRNFKKVEQIWKSI